jgi:hypothetical protein
MRDVTCFPNQDGLLDGRQDPLLEARRAGC